MLKKYHPTPSSSNIAGFAYDTHSSTLLVVFNNAKSYLYKKIPSIIYKQMQEADSVGSFHAKNIKNNPMYPFELVSTPEPNKEGLIDIPIKEEVKLEIKVGRRVITLIKGDYLLDNGACWQACKDNGYFYQEGFDKIRAVQLPKKALKKIDLSKLRKVKAPGLAPVTKYYP